MSGRTLAMMIIILALNWGGFMLLLAYGVQRDRRKRQGAGDRR